MIVRKKLRSGVEKKGDENKEGTRLIELNKFDPRIETDRQISENNLSSFLESVQKLNKNAVIFKSIESLGVTNETNFTHMEMQSICAKTIPESENHDEQALIKLLMHNLCTNEQMIRNIEIATRGESTNKLWFDLRKGRIYGGP